MKLKIESSYLLHVNSMLSIYYPLLSITLNYSTNTPQSSYLIQNRRLGNPLYTYYIIINDNAKTNFLVFVSSFKLTFSKTSSAPSSTILTAKQNFLLALVSMVGLQSFFHNSSTTHCNFFIHHQYSLVHCHFRTTLPIIQFKFGPCSWIAHLSNYILCEIQCCKMNQ